MQAIERFMDKVMPVPEAGCWLWIGAAKPTGYGNFYMDRAYVSAHRASYFLHKGEIPAGMLVMHKCDTPSCVNPDHLMIGTQQENIGDMFGKGRGRPNPSKGEGNPRALLTENDVRAIRASSDSTMALASQYGVAYHTVWHARKGLSWKEVA
jgi:hypothetical protein